MSQIFFAATIIGGLVLSSVSFSYSGGSGTPEEPYQIANKADLLTLAVTAEDYNKCFILTADIDMEVQVFTTALVAPVGGTAFTGVFDGNGHTISNFTCNTTEADYIGIFGHVDDVDAIIKDLTLINPDVNAAGDSHYIGSLVGLFNSGTIRNCVVEAGNVSSGHQLTGGLVGMNHSGTILNCYVEGNVSGTFQTGGLVGYNYHGTISNCYAAGNVSGGSFAGGLVGDCYEGTILNCCATASISGSRRYTGGLVGKCWWEGSTISNSYATGNVSGDSYAGGLVGENSGNISDCYAVGTVDGNESIGGLMGYNWYYGTISNCYATGNVLGGEDVGGLVGRNSATISNCYAKGSATGDRYTGGLVGKNYYIISNCYAVGNVDGNDFTGGLMGYTDGGSVISSFWDTQTSGWTTSAGGTGKTTAEMKTLSTFTSAGWDFVDTWDIGENQTYPFLRRYSISDLNYDSQVNFVDFALFADDWLK